MTIHPRPAPQNVTVTRVGASMLKGSTNMHTATVEFSTGHMGVLGIKAKGRSAAIKAAQAWINEHGHAAAWDRVERRRSASA